MKTLKICGKTFDLDKKTLVMGILNVTPDSFSDGGRFFSVDNAVKHAIQMEEDGADIIDVGGESTRPGSKPVSVDEEIHRVIPVVEKLIGKIKIPISVDTYKAEVALEALNLVVNMINYTTALRCYNILSKIISEKNFPICLIHINKEIITFSLGIVCGVMKVGMISTAWPELLPSSRCISYYFFSVYIYFHVVFNRII